MEGGDSRRRNLSPDNHWRRGAFYILISLTMRIRALFSEFLGLESIVSVQRAQRRLLLWWLFNGCLSDLHPCSVASSFVRFWPSKRNAMLTWRLVLWSVMVTQFWWLRDVFRPSVPLPVSVISPDTVPIRLPFGVIHSKPLLCTRYALYCRVACGGGSGRPIRMPMSPPGDPRESSTMRSWDSCHKASLNIWLV